MINASAALFLQKCISCMKQSRPELFALRNIFRARKLILQIILTSRLYLFAVAWINFGRYYLDIKSHVFVKFGISAKM
jgi:hypothetical protein